MSEAAENFLIEQGIAQKPSVWRRKVLGCIACRWADKPSDAKPKVYGYQILKCQGIQSGLLYPILQKLADAGVIEPHGEIIEKPAQGRLGGPVRKTYTPAETHLGVEFQAHLEKPAQCHLSEQDLLLASLPVVESF